MFGPLLSHLGSLRLAAFPSGRGEILRQGLRTLAQLFTAQTPCVHGVRGEHQQAPEVLEASALTPSSEKWASKARLKALESCGTGAPGFGEWADRLLFSTTMLLLLTCFPSGRFANESF